MISPQELKYFLEIARTENVSRAAERLGVSQPTLSLALQRIEDSLGAPLFLRNRTGMKLTKAGERLQAQAQHLMSAWDQTLAAVHETQHEISGTYRLGVHPSVALYTLPRFLKTLLEEHPKLSFQFSHGLSRHMAEDVISMRVDFGIVVNPPPHPDLVVKPLCTDEVTLWTVPGGRTDTLIFEPDLAQSQTLLRKLEKAKLRFPRALQSTNLEVISSLVINGCGVGILPNRVIGAWGSKARKFSADAPVFKDQICLIFRADVPKQAAARRIIDSITSSWA